WVCSCARQMLAVSNTALEQMIRLGRTLHLRLPCEDCNEFEVGRPRQFRDGKAVARTSCNAQVRPNSLGASEADGRTISLKTQCPERVLSVYSTSLRNTTATRLSCRSAGIGGKSVHTEN